MQKCKVIHLTYFIFSMFFLKNQHIFILLVILYGNITYFRAISRILSIKKFIRTFVHQKFHIFGFLSPEFFHSSDFCRRKTQKYSVSITFLMLMVLKCCVRIFVYRKTDICRFSADKSTLKNGYPSLEIGYLSLVFNIIINLIKLIKT